MLPALLDLPGFLAPGKGPTKYIGSITVSLREITRYLCFCF